jgi:hypothetical protein
MQGARIITSAPGRGTIATLPYPLKEIVTDPVIMNRARRRVERMVNLQP